MLDYWSKRQVRRSLQALHLFSISSCHKISASYNVTDVVTDVKCKLMVIDVLKINKHVAMLFLPYSVIIVWDWPYLAIIVWDWAEELQCLNISIILTAYINEDVCIRYLECLLEFKI